MGREQVRVDVGHALVGHRRNGHAGIADYVHVVQEKGIATIASCQAGERHRLPGADYPLPWRRIRRMQNFYRSFAVTDPFRGFRSAMTEGNGIISGRSVGAPQFYGSPRTPTIKPFRLGYLL